eukprot:s6313_g2.t1
MPHPQESRASILHVWLVSGEKLTSLPTEGLADVRALKRHLQEFCGTPRFRQRLLHNGRNLADDVALCTLATDIQLLLLPFVSLSIQDSSALRNAVVHGQVRVVEDILVMAADVNACELAPDGRPRDLLLREAAYLGHEEILRLLLEAGSALDSSDFTPLCAACYKGHVEIVSLLLGAGAEKDEISAHGTPLTWAAGGTGDQDQQVRIVRELLQARADLNKVDGAWHTPLSCAAMYGSDKMVRILLLAAASPDVICPGSEQSLLCWASENGSSEKVCMLVYAGADKDQISARRTPLTSAIGAAQMEVVQVLIEAGAILDKVDDELYTPLTRALWTDNVDIVRLLLAARANADMVCPYSKQTPLCAASATGRVEMVRQILLTGAALNRKCAGRTALASAASEGHVEVVRLLIIAGATLDSLDGSRYTPLDRASQNKHEEVVRLLLVAKARAS